METTQYIEKRFLELAHLLLEIMIEGQEFKVPDDFKMSEEAIKGTALALQEDFLSGKLNYTDGGLYYSGMTEDYGGRYERELYDLVQPSHKEVFQKKLKDLAQAAQELNDAWDMIDGDKEVMSKFDIRWPFQENLYYLALGDLKKWCENTAKKLDK